MSTHVKVVAVLLLVFGLFLLAGAFFAPVILGFVATMIGSAADRDADAGTAAAILGITGVTLSVVLATLSAPFLITAWGMLKLKPWSRIVGIVLAALCLIHFPFGTAFGIYALIILFKKETEALFVAKAA